MPPPLLCPDADVLRDLLDGSLADDRQAELTRHLDGCPDCQRTLETLAVGSSALPGFACPRPGRRSAFEPALRQAMAALRGDVSFTLEEEAPEDDGPLGFLDPPQAPGHLGRFGPYEVLEVIGRGGFGVVLKAWDAALNRLVAIKVLAPQLAVNPAARRRFAREAKAAAAVVHENVVPIHHVDSASGLPYLVMQYVPGPSLQQRLDASGPLELEEILRIGMQTAAGLAAAHAQGIVHRDVKPANILLENGVERVRLTDFGLARTVDDATQTQSGLLAGTPAYMAPEQARGESLDHRADLFSLGSVLYAACTGRPPFRAGSTVALLRRVSDETPEPVNKQNPRVPEWLVTIMNRLHAKDPAQRFQSAAEVAALFAGCLAHVQQPDRVPLPDLTRQGARGVERGPRRRRWLAAAAALVLLAGGLAAWAGNVLRVKTSEGILVIEVNDPGIRVSVDGSEVTITGAGLAELKVRAGQHRVLATKDGAEVRNELVEIECDGKKLVKVTLEPAIRDQARKTEVHRTALLKGHVGAVHRVAFSPDGKRLATAGADGSVRLWDGASGQEVVVLKGHTGPVVSVTFFPDGRAMLSVGQDGTARIWDLASLKIISTLKIAEKVQATSLQPDGRVLATASADGALRLWDVKTGKAVPAPRDAEGVRSVTFSPDGRRLLVGTRDGTARVQDAASGKPLGVEIRQGDSDGSYAFSPDGKVILSAGADKTVRVWDVATGKEIRAVLAATVPISQVVVSPSGKQVAVATGATVVLVDLQTGRTIDRLTGAVGNVTAVAFRPDGRRLAVAGESGNVALWDPLPASAAFDSKELRQKEQAARDTAASLAVETRVVPLKSLDAAAAAADVKKMFGPSVSVGVDDRANSVILRGTAEELPHVIEALRVIDGADRVKGQSKPGVAADKTFAFSMNAKPWPEVFQWLADRSGLPVVGDSKPTGTFTFTAPKDKQYTLAEIIDVINEALLSNSRKQKYLLIRGAHSYVLCAADEKIDPVLVPRLSLDELSKQGRTVLASIVVRLQSVKAAEAASEVKKMLGPFGDVIAVDRSNQLIIQDTAGNLKRIVQVLQEVDVGDAPPVKKDEP